jgi:predicted nucleic acid-binding protein
VFKAADAEQLRRAVEWLGLSEAYLNQRRLLPLDEPALTQFEALQRNKKLRKIGPPDLLIASIVLAYRARLVTRNLRDFRLVPGLAVENWID